MLYTDLTSAAAAEHQKDLIASGASARRGYRPGHHRVRNHHIRPFTTWRNWLEAGRL